MLGLQCRAFLRIRERKMLVRFMLWLANKSLENNVSFRGTPRSGDTEMLLIFIVSWLSQKPQVYNVVAFLEAVKEK